MDFAIAREGFWMQLRDVFIRFGTDFFFLRMVGGGEKSFMEFALKRRTDN